MADAEDITVPKEFITNDNHGGYIVVACALLLTWSLLFWLIRLSIRIGYRSHIWIDDIAASIGTLLGCVQSIVVILAVTTGGLGRRISSLTSSRLHDTELLVYASDILFIVVLACGKIATSELVARLTAQPQQFKACRVFCVLVGLWAVASILAVSIGCHPSHPWDMVDRCSNLPTSWIGIGVVDIISEICLFILPIVLVWEIRMPRSSKVVVLFAFASRLPIIAVIVARLFYLTKYRHSTDYTFDVTLASIFTQLEMHYGLFAMTLPCFRPFLKAFDTGTLATYAAQIEIGMGAMPFSSGQSPMQVSTQSWQRWSSRRTSSVLVNSQQRWSTNTNEGNGPNSFQPSQLTTFSEYSREDIGIPRPPQVHKNQD